MKKDKIFLIVLLISMFSLTSCRIKGNGVEINCNELTGECKVTNDSGESLTPDYENNDVNYYEDEYEDIDYGLGSWKYHGIASAELSKYYSNALSFYEYVPQNIVSSGDNVPLIIWLHGSGEKQQDCDSNKFLWVGLPNTVQNWTSTGLKNIPAIIMAPQLWSGDWSSDRSNETVRAVISYAKDTYNINENKIILMGHSLGGEGTYYIASKNQDIFSSIVMMSAPYLSTAGEYKEYFSQIPMLGYVEERQPEKFKDPMVSFFNEVGKSSSLTILNCGHGQVPREALIEDKNNDGVSDLIYWALKQNKNIILQ